MAAKKGWIKLYRSIQDSALWDEKPFDKCRAWIDLLLLANHEDKQVVFDKELITVKRGEYLTSIRKLSARWGWSKNKTDRFLSGTQTDRMLNLKRDNKKTIITIVNYDIYQDMWDSQWDTLRDTFRDTNELQTRSKEYKEYINNIVEKENLDKSSEIIRQIIDYLNAKCGTRYRPTSANTKKHINARLNEKYTFDDFKTVIDKKYAEWHDTKMEQYLKPDTLFGTKFEGYLNQTIVKQEKKTNSFNKFKQNDYDYDEFEKEFLSN